MAGQGRAPQGSFSWVRPQSRPALMLGLRKQGRFFCFVAEQPRLLPRRGPARYQGTHKGWGPQPVPMLPFLSEAPGGPLEEEEEA